MGLEELVKSTNIYNTPYQDGGGRMDGIAQGVPANVQKDEGWWEEI